MRNFSFIFLLFFSFHSLGQSGLVAHFPFDDCGIIQDITGNNDSAFPQGFSGGIGCACGVADTALVMNGEYEVGGTIYQDQVFLVGNYDNYFDDDDFSISIYFKPTKFNGIQTVYSKLDDCNGTTGVSLRYTAATNSLEAFVGENVTKRVQIFGQLNLDRCWHHVVLIKKGNLVTLYVDGVVKNKNSIGVMDVRNDSEFILGAGPCVVAQIDFPLSAHIDDLRVYNRAITLEEIEKDLTIETDIIGNRKDTLIVEGSSVDIFLGPTCAETFVWSPADPFEGVEDPMIGETRITPPESGTYVLSMGHMDGCVATDTINITVVNPDSLDCSEIFLPKAFTPNGDGLNDFYSISNPYAIVNFVSFEIFDRWGGRVYYSENAYEGWNGNFKGKKVKPGVCMYRVVYNCQGEEKIKLGSLTVLR